MVRKERRDRPYATVLAWRQNDCREPLAGARQGDQQREGRAGELHAPPRLRRPYDAAADRAANVRQRLAGLLPALHAARPALARPVNLDGRRAVAPHQAAAATQEHRYDT